jgi:hypothetical protein
VLDTTLGRRNTAPWWGLLFALASVGCNAAFFINAPLQEMVPWLSLVFAAVALIFLFAGLRKAFGRTQIYRGKILSVVITVIALLPAALTVFAFVGTRKLPSGKAAPQVGQIVPDFTLADTSGKPVSLDHLLAPSASQAQAPKAVLLIFYRGYW